MAGLGRVDSAERGGPIQDVGWLSSLFGRASYEPGIGSQGIGRDWNKVGPDFLFIRHGKEPAYDLVGESNYQENIAAVIPHRFAGGVYWQVVGQICFQDDNPVDPNAVVILIDGRPVGYVSRHDCKKVRTQITAQNPTDRPVICKAMIHGGFRKDDRSWASYGVKIGLVDPIDLVDCKSPDG